MNASPDTDGTESTVVRCAQCSTHALGALFARYGLVVRWVADGKPIPGSFWGESEAGLRGATLYCRRDTPIHSLFHEACHYICVDHQRRRVLDTDAGGCDQEENAVCYLQIVLADHLPGYDRHRMFEDMDAWGYSFRMGAARRWFVHDADDARAWLFEHGLIDATECPTWRVREP